MSPASVLLAARLNRTIYTYSSSLKFKDARFTRMEVLYLVYTVSTVRKVKVNYNWYHDDLIVYYSSTIFFLGRVCDF
jgi:hypothetical protein